MMMVLIALMGIAIYATATVEQNRERNEQLNRR